jgi:catechol 1,2-dioxygenase
LRFLIDRPKFAHAKASQGHCPASLPIAEKTLPACHVSSAEETSMISTHADVTPAVLAVMERTGDARLREILVSLVKHLHGFVRDVRLTEAEFREAAAILKEMGNLTSDTHNEIVLMAGSLGVSSLVCLLNNGDNGNSETSQSLLGPFWRLNSPRVENGGSIVRSETPGCPLFVSGRVTDGAGNPLAGAEVDVWHSSPIGLYDNQDPEQADMNLRGKFTTDEDGRFWFRTVKMVGYPIPTDGVVGRLLKAQNRHPYRPAHLHALIFKSGFKVLISQVYDPADPHIDDDVQFGVTRALVGNFVRHEEPHPIDPDVAPPWFSLDYAYRMERGEAVLPKAPIK